jgi:hypothetical protein
MLYQRIKSARSFAFKHLLVSATIAAICYGIVFGIWFPSPFDELAGGRDLFQLLITVDIVIGPVLSLIVYTPQKNKIELVRDIGVIAILQLAALSYGLHSTYLTRPVFIGFEGDRYRMVRIIDIEENTTLDEITYGILRGPIPLGVKLAKSTDKDFLMSIKLAINGLHPAFRPNRWVKYEEQKENVIQNAKSIDQLRKKHPKEADRIDELLSNIPLAEENLGYLPIIAGRSTDWSVLVNKKDGSILSYLPLDGW